MAKFEDGCYGSLKGIALIAKVLAGRCPMHYTRVAAGKGVIPDDLTPKTLEEPPEYVMDAMIASVTNPVDGECQVSVQINSAYVKEGFYATWLVLYAEDPDEGEVPFTALCLENEPEWIRPASSIVGKLAHFDIIAAVGDVDKVTATIDSDALVSYGELAKIIRGIAAGASQKDVIIPASGWVADTDTNGAFDWMIDIASTDITESMVPDLTIMPESLDESASCGLCRTSRAMTGALRLYSETIPTKAITVSLTLLETERKFGSILAASAAVARIDITIPTEGWAESIDEAHAGMVYIDIPDKIIEPELVPKLAIVPEHLGVAADCDLSTCADTLRGALRVYAVRSPSSAINASLALLGVIQNIEDKLPPAGGGAYVLPIASSTTPGVVKIGRGSGLRVDSSGNLSLDTATTEDVANIFGSNG